MAIDELGPGPQWLMVFHADAPDEAAELAAHLTQAVRVVRSDTMVLSPIFGAHTGPGIIGFAALPWPGGAPPTDGGTNRGAPRGPWAYHRDVVTEAARPDEQHSVGEPDQGDVDNAVRRPRRRWLAYLPLLFALGAIAALLVYADPRKIGIAFQRFNLIYIPAVVVLAVGFYIVQGVRWWTLNRALGIKFPLRDTVFLTETGQATALLPLGELTRALLVSKAAAVHLGTVVASETVQELLFVFMLFALALPKALSLHLIAIAVIVPMLFVIAIVAILTVERLYARVRRIIGRVPVLKRLRPAIDELHRDTRVLFLHADTYRYLPLSAAQAIMAVTLLWGVAQGVDPGKLSWTSAGFVYAVTSGSSLVELLAGRPRRGGGEYRRPARAAWHPVRSRDRYLGDAAARR